MSYVEMRPRKASQHGSALRQPAKSGMTKHLARRICPGGVGWVVGIRRADLLHGDDKRSKRVERFAPVRRNSGAATAAGGTAR